ncbi:MAG: hypothetical protein AAGB19_15495 [Cyanobacteria bacterium P01_F01_bin.3]
MVSPSFNKMRTYLHLVPVFGTVLSLWTLYGGSLYGEPATDGEETIDEAQRLAASRLSVLLGLGSVCAIALLGLGASTQASQTASLRFLLASSFVGSGYFLLSIGLIFRVATNRSIRLPGITQLSRRLP